MLPISSKRFLENTDGIAAVELALISPLLVAFLGVLVDFGLGFNTQLRLAGAVHAAAQTAFVQGQSLDRDSAVGVITSVTQVTVAALGALPADVRVLVNNAPDASAANSYYCVSGSGMPSWTSTGTVSNNCGGALTSGKFVTITATANQRYFFLPARVAAQITTLTDTAIVRVQ